MQQFLFLNIVCISILGFLSSYSDIKKGLIANSLVFASIAVAFALNFLNGFSLTPFLANGSLAFLFGFLLWLARLWSAGDAKLFLAFALLFPMSLYPEGTGFPAFSIILNSFAPAFALLFFFVLLKTSNAQKVSALKETFSPKTILSAAIFFFSFYWILNSLFNLLHLQLDFFFASILLFIVFGFAELLLPKKSIYFFAAVSIAFIGLEFNAVISQEFLSFFFSFLLLALLLLFFVLRLGFSSFGKPVPLEELQQGMVLLEAVFEKNGKIAKKKPLLPSFVNIFSQITEKQLVESGLKGLTAQDIALLQKAKSSGKAEFGSLLVQETLPFAPIIFIGTLISFFFAF